MKLTKSGEYELDSIYNLIPSFASLKSGKLKYKDLIDSFENGFVDRVKTDDLVPTQDGYVCLLNVIVDKSGLTSSGIISDEDFLKFSDNKEKTLPNLELRTSKSFESFAVVYLHKFDVEENIFDMDSLRDMIGKDDFKNGLRFKRTTISSSISCLIRAISKILWEKKSSWIPKENYSVRPICIMT